MKSTRLKIMQIVHILLVYILIPAQAIFVGFDLVPSMWHYFIPLLVIIIPYEIYYQKKWKEWKRANKTGYEIHA